MRHALMVHLVMGLHVKIVINYVSRVLIHYIVHVRNVNKIMLKTLWVCVNQLVVVGCIWIKVIIVNNVILIVKGV